MTTKRRRRAEKEQVIPVTPTASITKTMRAEARADGPEVSIQPSRRSTWRPTRTCWTARTPPAGPPSRTSTTSSSNAGLTAVDRLCDAYEALPAGRKTSNGLQEQRNAQLLVAEVMDEVARSGREDVELSVGITTSGGFPIVRLRLQKKAALPVVVKPIVKAEPPKPKAPARAKRIYGEAEALSISENSSTAD
ncbi:hypothetical protein M3Y99_00839300 [Aphelenchoides fujianensis]|nr:hypothetical protein M3Y99_00839300 [Aphelenchoides fujianensis]